MSSIILQYEALNTEKYLLYDVMFQVKGKHWTIAFKIHLKNIYHLLYKQIIYFCLSQESEWELDLNIYM